MVPWLRTILFPLLLVSAMETWSGEARPTSTVQCVLHEIDSLSGIPSISLESLASEIAARRSRVPEFHFIREEAERRGLRVWLFGGTAAGYSHYVKWDALRELGDARFQPNRFDYDYTNIFRSTQDLDIVVSGSAGDAEAFEQVLKQKFPYFLGSKTGWEVRSLKEARGDKGGLLGDFGFMNQHTDSNSTGMVELTDPPKGESVVRDIRDWDNNRDPSFLRDVDTGTLTFYHSPSHGETPRSKSGQNPPIFSVIRALTKAFQYDLKIRPEDLAIMQREIHEFDPARDLTTNDARRWIEKNGKKLYQHAVNIERAEEMLERLGLKQKLIQIRNNPDDLDSLAWWMNKEPLKSFSVGQGHGKTAQELGIDTVAHETNSFVAYESITRAQTGEPNVLISRKGVNGETASYGNGFYTRLGKRGARDTGITIRFKVDPSAREGKDFSRSGDYIVWHNKSAIRVIPESLQMSPFQYFEFLAEGKEISADDKALVWKLKRRLDQAFASGLVDAEEIRKIRALVMKEVQSQSSNHHLILQEWLKLEGARWHRPSPEVAKLAETSRTYRADPGLFADGLSRLAHGTEAETWMNQQFIPWLLKDLKRDIGDRALENALFSIDAHTREFGHRALADREAKNPTPFVRALKAIQASGGDAKAWLRSETHGPSQIAEKAAYLALHPELREVLSKTALSEIAPIFSKISNLSVFEEQAGSALPMAKSESFQFISYDFPADGKRVHLGNPSFETWDPATKGNPHEVTIKKSFEMQATPVTQLQWSLVMRRNPSHFNSGEVTFDIAMDANRPVELVSKTEVEQFMERLNRLDPDYNYRLPTEAEWEYAVRAGSDTDYFYGSDRMEMHDYGWTASNSDQQTHDVASLKPNASGLYDTYGNVWESMQDAWLETRPDHIVDPRQTTRSPAELSRGGAWDSHPVTSAYRENTVPKSGWKNLGLRLVRVRKKSESERDKLSSKGWLRSLFKK